MGAIQLTAFSLLKHGSIAQSYGENSQDHRTCILKCLLSTEKLIQDQLTRIKCEEKKLPQFNTHLTI